MPRRIVPAAKKYSHMRQLRGGDLCNATTKAGSDHGPSVGHGVPDTGFKAKTSTEVGLLRALIARLLYQMIRATK